MTLLVVGPLYAQSEARILLREATEKYKTGLFDDVVESLTALLEKGSLRGTQRTEARLLLANTYLARDSFDDAKTEVELLLRINPHFNPDVYETQGLSSAPLKSLVSEVRRELASVLVSSVSKKNENYREAPATVVLLTEEQIARRGYLNLEALVHDLPGFDITRGSGIYYANLYMRGYRVNSTNRMLFLVDGVEENSLWSSAVWLSRQYSLSNVKRVEVVYGPASTMYGSNAFLGVVNVITKDPSEVLGGNRRIGLRGQGSWGERNTWYGDLTAAFKVFSDVSFSVTGRLYRADERDLSGYSDWDGQLPDVAHYMKTLNATEQQAVEARQHDTDAIAKAYDDKLKQSLGGNPILYANQTNDWLLSTRLRISNLTLGFQHWRRDESLIGWFKDTYIASAGNRSAWIPRQTFFYAKYNRVLSDVLSVSSFTRYKLHDLGDETRLVNFNSYASGRLGLTDLAAHSASSFASTFFYNISRQLRHEMQVVFDPSEKVNVVGGLEFRSSIIQGEYVISDSVDTPRENGMINGTEPEGGNHYNSRDIGLYAQASFSPVDRLKLVVGARVDNNSVRGEAGYGTVFNFRGALVATPGAWILKTIVSQAFKDADNFSKYATSASRKLPAPTLLPERVYNVEVSVGKKLSDHVFWDAVGYWAEYDRAIGSTTVCLKPEDTLPDCTTTTQHGDLGPLQIRGIQSTVTVDPAFEIGDVGFSGYANYTFTDPYSTDFKSSDSSGTERLRIGDIASHQLNVGLNAHWKGLNVNLRMNYVGARERGASTTVKDKTITKVGAYTVFNGALSYQVRGGIKLQLIANNLFDVEYFHPGVRGAGSRQASQIPQDRLHLVLRTLIEF